MILVDSSVWINYFNGISNWQTDLLDNYLSNTLIVIGDLILTEVLQGFRSNTDFETAKNFLSEVAWDTEVWLAEMPDHLIHYNGDRFLGPRG